MPKLPLLILLLPPFLATLLATPAFAVYRCESASKTIYSDSPCGSGATQKEVDLSGAAVSPANAQQARIRAERERARLESLTRSREKEQHEADRQEASAREQKNRAATKKRQQCDQLAEDKQRADDNFVTAPQKWLAKAQLAAKRADEKYRKNCPVP